ncbi:MAG: hypothetical protein KJ072_20425 [Verrucomicrobia bacterium]|nr:hypothetical protein [Verrucomicrobiota bacterium]
MNFARTRHLATVLAIASVLLASGGHWLLLQSVAWGGMLISYSTRTSISEAISRTFDGKHPCKLCRVVQAGREKETDRPTLPSPRIPDLFCDLRRVTVPSCQAELPQVTSALHRLNSLDRRPPIPPPKAR